MTRWTVLYDSTSIHSEPRFDSPIIEQLDHGFQVLELHFNSEGSWMKCWTGTLDGWINSALITPVNR